MPRQYTARELVVYEKQKYGTHPGPRAHDVHPATTGDSYAYFVNKFWIVESRDATSGRLMLRTPTGKLHAVAETDPALRRLTLKERLWLLVKQRDRLRSLLGTSGLGGQHE
jgi:hypothetical protein